MVTIKQRCKEGNISISEFIEFTQFKPAHRTHCLDIGDYVVLTSLFREGLDIEKIAELEYLGEHDFRTVKGATGPIEGNLFIKLGERGEYKIIEGDRPSLGKGSVYRAVKQWQEISSLNKS